MVFPGIMFLTWDTHFCFIHSRSLLWHALQIFKSPCPSSDSKLFGKKYPIIIYLNAVNNTNHYFKDISTVLLIRALDFTYRHPIDYHRHNANKRSRRTIITAYIKKVIFAAFIFCIPKFFESKIVARTEEIEVADPINDSNKMVMKQTGTCCQFG